MSLGIGVYSYLAAAIMMPLYLAATLVVLVMRREYRAAVIAVAAFAVMLAPLALWQLAQPDRYGEIVAAYRLNEPQQTASLLTRVLQIVDADAVLRRADMLWDTFNPSRLFFTGESSLNISTRLVGTFLLPVMVFLAVGVRALVRDQRGAIGWLILFGLFSAPLPAVIMMDVEIRRWLVLLPFAALVTTFGVEAMLRGGRVARATCLALLAAMALQFVGFERDYFGAYRARSAFWFGGNVRGALADVLDRAHRDPPATIYISSEIPWADAYWRFYTTASAQTALLERTRYVRIHSGELPQAAPDTLLVAPLQDPIAAEAVARAGWTPSHVVHEIDGKPSFAVYGMPGT